MRKKAVFLLLQFMKTITKQFSKNQLLDMDVLQLTKTELEENNSSSPSQFIQNGGVQFHPNFRRSRPPPLVLVFILSGYD